jgi:hypothetical protein
MYALKFSQTTFEVYTAPSGVEALKKIRADGRYRDLVVKYFGEQVARELEAK